MNYVKIANKTYRMLGNFGFKNSNSEVTFNDIVIDFTGHNAEDIPFKYQEIQIYEDEKTIFTGYLDTINFSKLSTNNQYKEMTLTLLSPLKLATKRSISLIGTFRLEQAIRRILQPLIDDGFKIVEMNVPDGQITTSFIIETVENAMNNVGAKRNIFWHIDENKNIYVNSIDFLFGKETKKQITDKKEEGLLLLQPTISNIDYANVINFKNVRLIYSSYNRNYSNTANSDYKIAEVNKIIKKGDIISFINPIVLDENLLRTRITELFGANENEYGIENDRYNLKLTIQLENGNYNTYSYYINLSDKNTDYLAYKTSGNMSFNESGGSEGEIVLQRDNFFKNLITGFRWNVDSTGTIVDICSDTALRYTTMKFIYSKEIEKLKGIISQTGQIEKVVDYSEKWTTLAQLIAYARSLMTQNSNIINEINIKYDKNQQLKIGDIIEIDRAEYFIKGKFAVKDIEYIHYSKMQKEYNITLKNADLLSSYIDLFRPNQTQESESNIESVILSEFIEESFKETHVLEESE